MTKEKETSEKPKKYFDQWKKYAFGMYSLPLLTQKDMGGLEGQAARYLHIKESRGSEAFAIEMAENPKKTLVDIIKEDSEQYQKFFSELTVEEALQHMCAETGYNYRFGPELLKFKGKKISELEESARKYDEATKAYVEAKTPEEAAKAKTEQIKYEKASQVFETINLYDLMKLRTYVLPAITREAVKIDQIKNYGLKEPREKKAA
ncbi:MAG: hypothetical protein K6T16_01425 [Candidatus Pacearchaeota archaeon]|nr:hypothetical protein [Candidatus Pacearchaeota archaeon]